ncbi:MAG: Hsp20/alpha crystallin family protein [Bacteroidetes bacterium]|nr:Hsp20/alpha crystallin family protein [Bacteroidota bacterium]
MNLVRWNNQPRVTNFFDNAFLNEMLTNEYQSTNCRKPATNIVENEDNFELNLAVPGLEKEDIKIDLEDNLLTISAEKEAENKEVNYSRKEFTYNAFSRSFKLPKTVETEKIKADYINGVLNIKLPKMAEAKFKKAIKIS